MFQVWRENSFCHFLYFRREDSARCGGPQVGLGSGDRPLSVGYALCLINIYNKWKYTYLSRVAWISKPLQIFISAFRCRRVARAKGSHFSNLLRIKGKERQEERDSRPKASRSRHRSPEHSAWWRTTSLVKIPYDNHNHTSLFTWWSKKDVMIISCPVHPSVSFFTAWSWNYRHLARGYDRNIHCPRPSVSWSRIGSRRYFIGLRNYWIESHGTTADVCLRAGNTNMIVGRDHHREVSKSAWPWQISRVVRSLGIGVKYLTALRCSKSETNSLY